MTDPYARVDHDGHVSVHEVDGKFWWSCTCGIAAPHGRTSRRGARRDGDKHLNRAVNRRPTKREREAIAAGLKPLKPASSAGGPPQPVALPSKPEPFRGERRAPEDPRVQLEPAAQAGSTSPGKPLVLTWYGDEND